MSTTLACNARLAFVSRSNLVKPVRSDGFVFRFMEILIEGGEGCDALLHSLLALPSLLAVFLRLRV